MDNKIEKLNNYLKLKKLDELASLRMLVSSICHDYDMSLTTYAKLNDDMSFSKMSNEVNEMHEKRNKMHGLLMQINSIIEEKLFSLYE